MAFFVDGMMSVAEARDLDVEEEIQHVTGLSLPTVRNKLREAHGATKLSNLFKQWPHRATELANFTASFALEREAFRDIAHLTGVGPRVVRRRLESAHGKTLVQNVFSEEWPDEHRDRPRNSTGALQETRRAVTRRENRENGAVPEELRAGQREAVVEGPAKGPKSAMFRRYDLVRARATRDRRDPAVHQREALERLHRWYASRPSPHAGGILALPTGGGKTFTTVRFLCESALSDGYKVLWLAHTHHLLEQALEEFGPSEATPNRFMAVAHIAETRSALNVRVVSATPGHFPVSTISPDDDVVIASLATAVAAFDRGHQNLHDFLDASDGKLVVVFDEAHHAPAPSYSKLLTQLLQAHPRLLLLGLTATPTYSDERRRGWLKKLFPQDVLYTVSSSRLMAAGVLSKPLFENRRTEVTVELEPSEYQRWVTSYGDLPDTVVNQLADNSRRNDFIADCYVEERARYGKTLIFADRWYQCDYLREALRKRGVRADVMYSQVDAKLRSVDERNRRTKDDNARALERFRRDELDVLINVRMLTEGTDVPSVKTVFLTRQTTSQILLTQMIGRALRGPAFKGTESAHIVSFIDNWRQVIAFADYEALPSGQADEAVPEYGKRPPLQLISIELVRRLAREMYKGGGAIQPPFLTLLPVGWYCVEYETRGAEGDDILPQRQLILVFDNEKPRYEAFITSMAQRNLGEFASEALSLDDVRSKLAPELTRFGIASEDNAAAEQVARLVQIVRHMAQMGEPPKFFTFDERSLHDLDRLARDAIDRNIGIRELEDALRAEYARLDRFWRSLYPQYGLFSAQYQATQRRILDAKHHGGAEQVEEIVTTAHLPMREPSEAVKAAVFRRDGQACCCCGAKGRLEVDHITPSYLGGASDMDQLQTLCRTCNSKKSINELNFRVARTPLERAPAFAMLTAPADGDAQVEASWTHFIQRSINFFYRCAAVHDIEADSTSDVIDVRLRPGLVASWLEPHLGSFNNGLAEARRSAGLPALARVVVSETK